MPRWLTEQYSMTIAAKIEQIQGALNQLAALPPPAVPDEEGTIVPGPYEEQFPLLRDAIIVAGGPDFAAGIAIAGYDLVTIEQAALTGCLKVSLQLAYSTRWLLELE
jgi:hypothetical protein